MMPIYVSGKGAVGKSTFAKQLAQQLNFVLISLDDVIHNEFADNFELYLPNGAFPYDTVNFVSRVRELILESSIKCVVEGTIKCNDLINQIFCGFPQFTFYYIIPIDECTYARNIRERFLAEPEKYGRLGFLKKMDVDYKALMMMDYNINGINGTIINDIINQVASCQYKKINELLEYYHTQFHDIKIRMSH